MIFSWLLIIILAYLFFAISFFGDKVILSGPPNPGLYTLYVGGLNLVVLFLLPFIGSEPYHGEAVAWALLTGLVSVMGLYAMFTAIEQFEVSRVMSTIGSLQPLLVLLATGLLWGFQAITKMNFLAFVLLLVGSVVISVDKKISLNTRYLALTFGAAIMFSLAYVFSKFVFLEQSFFHGIVIIALATFAWSLFLLLLPKVRSQLFVKQHPLGWKLGSLFLLFQISGGAANFLQSLAIDLVPVSSLAILNALRGIQYVFLFVITLIFSLWFPKVLKEDVSLHMMVQKILCIIIIFIGLAILVI